MLDRISSLMRPVAALLFSFFVLSEAACAQEPTGDARLLATALDRDQVKQAVARGTDVLRKGVKNYPTHRDCFSCHHQALPMLAFSLQERSSVEADLSQFLSDEQTQSILQFTDASFAPKVPMMREGNGVGGRSLTVAYGLWTFDVGGVQANATTEAMVQYLCKSQAEDGAWDFQSHRPPAASSRMMTTAIAVYGLRAFGEVDSESLKVRTALERAGKFANRHSLDGSHEELIGALWLDHMLQQRQVEDVALDKVLETVLESRPTVAERLKQRVELLWSRQRADSGWSQTDAMESDAYATGQALVMLTQVMGAQVHDDARFERAVAYLLGSQCEDGSWHVVTRAKPVQVYFDNGDPHGKDQFISMMATSWSVAALANFHAGGVGPLDSVLVARRMRAD